MYLQDFCVKLQDLYLLNIFMNQVLLCISAEWGL